MQKPDVALGGGLGFFLPASAMGRRRDGCDLVQRAGKAGYEVWTRGTKWTEPRPGRLLGLFANDHVTYVLDDRSYPEDRRDPSLAAMTGLALDVLGKGGKSFFLMVEGGRIDHAGHGFDAAGVAAETQAFDEAVQVALRYQKEHPELLIALTADHATGGLALNDYVDWAGLRKQSASVAWLVRQVRSAGGGTDLLAEKTGYSDWTDDDLDQIRKAPSDDDAERVLGALLGKSGRNGVTWMPRITPTTFGHTGEDVPFLAGGPGAERFRGSLDNAEIPAIFAGLLGWTWPPKADDFAGRTDSIPEECGD
jgi:alkaline phosphatase